MTAWVGTVPWDGEHPEEWLSAFLDGALEPAERQAVAAHLARCAPCRDELDGEALLRDSVRGLPVVEPPAGFFEHVLAVGPAPRLREQRRTRAAAVNLVAIAALWLGVLGVFGISTGDAITPDLRGLLGQHSAMSESGESATGQATAVAAPRSLSGDYVLVRAGAVNGWPQYLYEDGEGRTLSVFVRPGRLDVDALPAQRRPVAVNGVPGWAVTLEGEEVVFLQKTGTVVVIVGEGLDGATADVAMEPSLERSDEPGVVDRMVAAGRGLLETFGLAA